MNSFIEASPSYVIEYKVDSSRGKNHYLVSDFFEYCCDFIFFDSDIFIFY